MKKLLLIVLVMLNGCISDREINCEYAGKIDAVMEPYTAQDLFSGAILVARGRNIIYRRAFGRANREWDVAMTEDTKFRIGSVSKSFTAMIISQLVEEGQVHLDATISEYLPDYSGRGRDVITIHQLLTHTSGILNSIPANEEAAKEKQYHSLEDLVKYAERAELYFEPGTGFHYSNLGYSMLALIAEQVTGKPFDQLLRERIFHPAGMHDTKQDLDLSIEDRMATGYEYDLLKGYQNTTFLDMSYAQGAGGITSTPDDLYRWCLAIQQSHLITSDLKLKMLHSGDLGRYGYGWFIRQRSVNGDTIRIVDHTGSINGFGSYLAWIPIDSVVVIVLKNSRSHNYIRPVFASGIGRDIISILYGKEIEPLKKSIAMEMARVIGSDGVESAVQDYYRLKKDHLNDYSFAESELNKLGIELLFKYEMTDEALKIFEINMREYPKSYNTYDSYAYVLMQKQDYQAAINYYHKGLEILQKYPDDNQNPQIRENADQALKYITEMKEKL